MVTPDSGAVAFDARDITHLPMYKRRSPRNRLSIAGTEHFPPAHRLAEPPGDPRDAQHLAGPSATRRAERLLDQFGLHKVRNQKAMLCSGGEKRKLEIARALITQPKLILLDEPFSAVDPIAVEDLQREVKRLKEEFGKSVLITDHNVAQTLRVCDRALIINDGRVFKEGTPREIINDESVRAAYLGNTFRGDEFDGDGTTHHRRRRPQTPRTPRQRPPPP